MKNEAVSLVGKWLDLKVIVCISYFPYYCGHIPDKNNLRVSRIFHLTVQRDSLSWQGNRASGAGGGWLHSSCSGETESGEYM